MAFLYTLLLIGICLLVFIQLKPHTASRWGLGLERQRSGLELKSQAIAGFDIPYLEGGQGEVLVLVHGFGGDKDNFTRMARFLTPHFRVIQPDLPGFGDATRDPAARYRMADQVERLHAFFQALGVQKMVFGGNSMGGFIACEYAARYPEQVKALWLLDAAGTAAAHASPMLKQYLATGDSPLLLRSQADVARLIRTTMARPPYFPGFLKRTLGARAIADYPLHCEIFKDLSQHSPMLEARYTTLPTPALIVWGAEDAILNPAAAQTQERLFPHHQTIVMQGIGHLPMLEAPAQTAQDFLKFARTLPA
ncbi:alpha/beta fold hydrolase [Rhodoferax aquaticus]|uniref:Alpha/beta hydrolase n=1 Tax=Rhodoferax aquaticus TaxID=2527691 RepID=A0A515EU69_9BURK|nr:alpha/beta hydrolase [Rhodoferax aquaticus]QDL56225.1 alpha/beta hydrolase [Rhodoferax aquaticus]